LDAVTALISALVALNVFVLSVVLKMQFKIASLCERVARMEESLKFLLVNCKSGEERR